MTRRVKFTFDERSRIKSQAELDTLDEQPAVTYSTERLIHFHCSVCGQWWAIGDAPLDRGWYCPWCGDWHGVCVEARGE